mmetsp:Transcript_5921/g.10785  ORF Transcript_5921/g.10785 Transcript_5921/m.10785 type:complete len:216 (-) Transcript_5921:3753-4400(-)
MELDDPLLEREAQLQIFDVLGGLDRLVVIVIAILPVVCVLSGESGVCLGDVVNGVHASLGVELLHLRLVVRAVFPPKLKALADKVFSFGPSAPLGELGAANALPDVFHHVELLKEAVHVARAALISQALEVIRCEDGGNHEGPAVAQARLSMADDGRDVGGDRLQGGGLRRLRDGGGNVERQLPRFVSAANGPLALATHCEEKVFEQQVNQTAEK